MKAIRYDIPDEMKGQKMTGQLVGASYDSYTKQVFFTVDFDIGDSVVRLNSHIKLGKGYSEDWKTTKSMEEWSNALGIPCLAQTFRHIDGVLDLENNGYEITALVSKGAVISYFNVISAKRIDGDPSVESLKRTIAELRGIVQGYRELNGVKKPKCEEEVHA